MKERPALDVYKLHHKTTEDNFAPEEALTQIIKLVPNSYSTMVPCSCSTSSNLEFRLSIYGNSL